MREETCCFTGHRAIPLSGQIFIRKHLERVLESLIEKGMIYFGSGGAIGFDTLAALTVLKLRETHTQIKLIMVLPCHGQDKRWSKKDKKIYACILKQADKVVYTSE